MKPIAGRGRRRGLRSTPTLLALAMMLAGCRGGAPTPSADSPPRLAWFGAEHDFGNLRVDEVKTHRFRFRNAGGQALVIGDVGKTCGCTTTRLSAETIPPGGRGWVEVSFNPAGMRGAVERQLYLRTNDPDQAVAPFVVRANVVVDVDWQPQRVEFGRVIAGETATRKVSVVFRPGLAWRITQVATTSPTLKLGSVRQNGTSGISFEALVDGEAPLGSLDSVIMVGTTVPGNETITIPVSGAVVGTIELAPPSLQLSRKPEGLVRIRRSEGHEAPIEVLGVESSTPQIVAKADAVSPTEVELRVELQPTEERFSGTVKVKTSDRYQPELTVPVSYIQPVGR